MRPTSARTIKPGTWNYQVKIADNDEPLISDVQDKASETANEENKGQLKKQQQRRKNRKMMPKPGRINKNSIVSVCTRKIELGLGS